MRGTAMIQDNGLSFTLPGILGISGLGIAAVVIDQASDFMVPLLLAWNVVMRASPLFSGPGERMPPELAGFCADVHGHRGGWGSIDCHFDHCGRPTNRTLAHLPGGVGRQSSIHSRRTNGAGLCAGHCLGVGRSG